MTDTANNAETPDWVAPYLERMDQDGYVPFNRDRRLGQNQYASRYADGRHDSPNLGEGLRWRGNPSDYHFLMIHHEDLVIFHERVKEHKHKAGRGLL